MLKIKNITIKNFLSVGAVSQAIKFEDKGFVLIIGENLDQGGNGARNGVGKSTIIQALSYALFDATITPIKKDNMINMVNSKNMMVTVELEVDGVAYRIERGRKPNVLRFYIAGNEQKDEAQGENRQTQAVIERLLGMSHDMFKGILALSTYNQPFLFMRAGDQRALIEELFGITQLSKKADILRKQLSQSKTAIKEEEVRIATVKDSNAKVNKTIVSLDRKSIKFIKDKEKSILDWNESIEALSGLDIDAELAKHGQNDEYKEQTTKHKEIKRGIAQSERELMNFIRQIEALQNDLAKADAQICPTCEQPMVNHADISEKLKEEIAGLLEHTAPIESQLNAYTTQLEGITIPEKPVLFYDNITDVYDHKRTQETLVFQLTESEKQINPYIEQIETLQSTAIGEIDYSMLNEFKNLLQHQDFLFKLLTSKDSFIRKKIIDQNLPYLNSRIRYYLNKIGLPHNVDFKNDLSVEIIMLGQQFDFGQLSRGQQNRLVLAFSWAFRDVWESTGHQINLLFIDEMIDSGLDTMGVENTLDILKKQSRERSKDIFLISHKEDLQTRVNEVLTVTMENGFTSYETD